MKVYIPTMEELEMLQSLGINVYKYIVAKVVETIIMETIIYDESDIFEILNYLGNHPEIVYGIFRMYPEKLNSSIITSKDPILCSKLIQGIRKIDNTIYRLDSILMNIDESILLDENIIKSTTRFLAANLSSCPKYRFDYQGPNILLDRIFSCELPITKTTNEIYGNLMLIDPIYAVKLDLLETTRRAKTNQNLQHSVKRGIAVYTNRYGIDDFISREYQLKDIINKPDEHVKKLIKCLEYHKNNYQ